MAVNNAEELGGLNRDNPEVVRQGQSTRTPQPRTLNKKESLDSITQWKTTVRNYYRRDDHFKRFLLAGATWNPAARHHGFQAETDGLRRPAADVADDLNVFLNLISGFLPFSFLKEKLELDTKNMKDVWNIIFEVYGHEITQDSFLDFADLPKDEGETHRQFFERLNSHIRRHLTPANTAAAGMNSGVGGDTYNITIGNMVVAHWLKLTDPRMVKLVRLEYAAELKQGVQLIDLLPRIAKNVETLLTRAEATINTVQGADMEEMVEAHLNRMGFDRKFAGSAPFKKNKRGGSNNFSGGRNNFSKSRSDNVTCHHCELLNQKLKGNFSTSHSPDACFRQRHAVRLMEVEAVQSEVETDTGQTQLDPFSLSKLSSFQSKESARVPGSHDILSMSCDADEAAMTQLPEHTQRHSTLVFSDTDSAIRAVQAWKSGSVTQKAASPSLLVTINGNDAVALLDEGANLSCVDLKVASRNDIEYVGSNVSARAAGSGSVAIAGVCKSDLVVKTVFDGETVLLNVGKAVIVPNLGVDLLLGEPAKATNFITTDPSAKTLSISLQDRVLTKPYLSPGGFNAFTLCRSEKTTYLLAGEKLSVAIPERMLLSSHLAFQPRGIFTKWLRPRVLSTPTSGLLTVKNVSGTPVTIKRGQVFGDLRSAIPTSLRALVDWSKDTLRFRDTKLVHETMDQATLLSSVRIDPDNVLKPAQRKAFEDLILKFREVFNKQPGQYNGCFGEVNNSISFTEIPPPNGKIYSPQYSEAMKVKLGEKMDALEKDGVLCCPEEIGISVEFVNPSLLVPKQEAGDYRFVTDFGALNQIIRKSPSASPSIPEAKRALASKPYHVHLDLSQYFYQAGVRAEDAQYLGVIHPFKGLRVYTKKPMGLKNASEDAYELLARLFGDMCQAGHMTRMADGLYVLGSSVDQLLSNFTELLTRLKMAGLTLKPSKVEVVPQKSVLFGWEVNGTGWSPQVHTTSALGEAPKPKTVTQLRSFLGSLKQLYEGMPRYAAVLKPLELMVHSSVRDLSWSREQEDAFEQAKALASHFIEVHSPRPDDKLNTYSDWSEENRAVGGRLEIERKLPDGTISRLHAGHFSTVLDKFKQKWWPCEGEAAAIRLTLEHFAPWIRESKNSVTHYTDNRSCVQAYRRSLKGAYSTSSRIAAFLTGLSALSLELVYRPGKDMLNEDYTSRHPRPCLSDLCQLCKFGKELQDVGDNCANINVVTVQDITSGAVNMPFAQKKAWTDLQHNDNVHNTVRYLIKVGQRPDKHKTKGDNTLIKHLYGYFLEGKLKVDDEGTILIKVPQGHFNGFAISIPNTYAPGLIQALHYRMQHPSRSQMSALAGRYFHAIGLQKLVNEVSDNCHQCLALRPLPKSLTEPSTTIPTVLGARFSADVIERHSQKLLAIRESLSSFTMLKIIPDQTAVTLKDNTLEAILPLVPATGAVVRVDGATAWQSLEAESRAGKGVWGKYNIKIEVGNLLNINKNPEAENCVKETQKEILRLDSDIKVISSLQLLQVQKQMNTRVRFKGWAAQEIILRREQVEGKNIDVMDVDMSARIKSSREVHNSRTKTDPPSQTFEKGDLVFIKPELNKNHARDTHLVVGTEKGKVKLKKLKNQLRKQTYSAEPNSLVKLPRSPTNLRNESQNPVCPPQNEMMDDSLLNGRGRPLRQAARQANQANRALANLNCFRCRTNHRVGWCPEEQDEDTIDQWWQVSRARQTTSQAPAIKASQEEAQPPVNPALRVPVIVRHRSQSPKVQSPNPQQPQSRPQPRKSYRVRDIPDYKELHTKGRQPRQ